MLSAALANAVIIIVMSPSLQVIVRYNIQREKESRLLTDDILQWTSGSYIFVRQTEVEQSKLNVNCSYHRFFLISLGRDTYFTDGPLKCV